MYNNGLSTHRYLLLVLTNHRYELYLGRRVSIYYFPEGLGSAYLQDGSWEDTADSLPICIYQGKVTGYSISLPEPDTFIDAHLKGPQDPHLVICPLSVLSSWETVSSLCAFLGQS